MSIKHNWFVGKDLQTTTVGDKNDVVNAISWGLESIEIVDGVQYMASSGGNIPLKTDNLVDFTEFSDLTEQQVISWVKTALVGVGSSQTWQDYESAHVRNIEIQKSKASVKKAPWTANTNPVID